MLWVSTSHHFLSEVCQSVVACLSAFVSVNNSPMQCKSQHSTSPLTHSSNHVPLGHNPIYTTFLAILIPLHLPLPDHPPHLYPYRAFLLPALHKAGYPYSSNRYLLFLLFTSISCWWTSWRACCLVYLCNTLPKGLYHFTPNPGAKCYIHLPFSTWSYL